MNDLIAIRERLKKKNRLHKAQLLVASKSHCLNVATYRLPHKKKK